MSDLKIADWEYLHAEQFITVYLTHLKEAAGAFCDVMNRVRAQAVSDGAGGIATMCEAFAQNGDTIAAQWAQAGDAIAGQADGFVTRIDELDQFIY